MLSPHDAIKIAEKHQNLTPKERQKTLALGIYYLLRNEPNILKPSVEFEILWGFSQLRSPYEIPDFDPEFVVQLVSNPKDFADYR